MEKLLLTMAGHEPVEELMPCLETLVRPGITVMFLLPYPVESRSYLLDHWVTTESVRDAMAVGRKIQRRYDWEAQKELAWQIVAPAAAALEARGVGVEVHLYSGSRAKVIKNYTVDKDIHWIMTQFSPPGFIGYLSAKALVPSGWSSHLLSVRSGPKFSQKQRQQVHTLQRTGTRGWIESLHRRRDIAETPQRLKSRRVLP
jgi:hypothetical protein